MCKALQVSRSGYYGWLNGKPSMRSVRNVELIQQIRQVHQKSRSTYGSPRITRELHKQGIHVSRPLVARLMRRAGIRSCIARKYRVQTTDSNHHFKVAENLLNRSFSTNAIARAWVSDITYIKTGEGWVYLTIILDLADRCVVGWTTSRGMTAWETTVAAWKKAIRQRPVTSEMIFHSDRGVQYACTEFKELLKANPNVRQSMSRRANCWDNAVAESFFKTLKVECTHRKSFATRKQAEVAIFEYVETWYNTQRMHSSLNYLTPLEYGNKLQNQKSAA